MDLIHRECIMKLIKMFSIDAKQVFAEYINVKCKCKGQFIDN